MDDNTALLTPVAEEHELGTSPFVRTSTLLMLIVGITACAVVIVILVGAIVRTA